LIARSCLFLLFIPTGRPRPRFRCPPLLFPRFWRPFRPTHSLFTPAQIPVAIHTQSFAICSSHPTIPPPPPLAPPLPSIPPVPPLHLQLPLTLYDPSLPSLPLACFGACWIPLIHCPVASWGCRASAFSYSLLPPPNRGALVSCGRFPRPSFRPQLHCSPILVASLRSLVSSPLSRSHSRWAAPSILTPPPPPRPSAPTPFPPMLSSSLCRCVSLGSWIVELPPTRVVLHVRLRCFSLPGFLHVCVRYASAYFRALVFAQGLPPVAVSLFLADSFRVCLI